MDGGRKIGGDEFETALCLRQLICTTNPIVLNGTDLIGKNPTTISLDYTHCDTLDTGEVSLGSGYETVLTRACKGYEGDRRFDFMLGSILIQMSIDGFGRHSDKDSTDIRKAFNDRDEGTNQIERYLNDVFGPGHSAKIDDTSGKFVVTKGGVPAVPGFRIVYISGSPGNPAHHEWANQLPDVLHVSLEELREALLNPIIQGLAAARWLI